jgi:hypothetical protein
MPDEFKTLLKIEGDASSAQKAVAETRAATEQLGEASAKSEKQTTEAAAKTSEALAEKAESVKKAKTGFDKLAESMGISTHDARQFRQLLGQISPELAGLLDIAMKGEGAFKTLFSGIGAAAITAAVSIQMITAALHAAAAAAARAQDEIKRVQAASDEARRRGQERTEELSDVLAKAGIVSEAATGKARGIEDRMLRQGFSQQAIRAVIPLAVDKAGEQILTDEELASLAAMEEFAPGKLAIQDPRELARVRRKGLGFVTRRPGLVGDWRQAIVNRQARQAAGVAQMDSEAIARTLTASGETIPAAELDQAVEDVKRLVTTGRVGDEGLNLFWAETDRLAWERRQANAARRARSLGLLGNEAAVSRGAMTGEQVLIEKAKDEVGDITTGLGRLARRYDPTVKATEVAGSIVNFFNHGLQVFGGDNRGEQIPRVKHP